MECRIAAAFAVSCTGNVTEPLGPTVRPVPFGKEIETPGTVASGVKPSAYVCATPDLFSTMMFLVRVVVPETSTAPNDTLTSPASSALNATTCVAAAAAASMRPAPVLPAPTYGPTPFAYNVTSCPAVFIASAFNSSTVHPG